MPKAKTTATAGPTATDAVSAAPAEAKPTKPNLAERVTKLEINAFGHAPHAEPASDDVGE